MLNGDKMLVMHRNKFGREYYTLVGGEIDLGEGPEQALAREVAEETGLQIANPRLVIYEDHDKFYGPQYVYLCDYVSGEPKITPGAIEDEINKLGKNLYETMWLPLDGLAEVPFVSPELKAALLEFLPDKFPTEPVTL